MDKLFPNPKRPIAQTFEPYEQPIAHLLMELNNFTFRMLARYTIYGTLTPAWKTCLQNLERLYHEINANLGGDPPSTGSRRTRLCDHVPGRLQRRCPWPSCQLGGGRRQGAAAGSGVGNDDRPSGDLSTRGGV